MRSRPKCKGGWTGGANRTRQLLQPQTGCSELPAYPSCLRSVSISPAFSTIAGALLFLAVNFMFSSLFFIDLEPFNYLENVCEYYKEYFAQYGEDFVCECEDNRLESFYNWVKGLNGGGGE